MGRGQYSMGRGPIYHGNGGRYTMASVINVPSERVDIP